MMPPLSFERTPITLLLMGTMIALEVLGFVDDASRRNYYNSWLGVLPVIWTGQEIWRPFTTTLLHANPLHAFFNIYILALFGATLEHWLGWGRMIALVVFLAFVSTLPQFFYSNVVDPPAKGAAWIVGFSGVNYGFFGLLWVGRRYRTEFNFVCNDTTVQILMGWFFLCILLTNLGVLPVANIAHGAGLIFGVLIALTIFRPRERWKWAPLLGVATALALGIMVYPQLRVVFAA